MGRPRKDTSVRERDAAATLVQGAQDRRQAVVVHRLRWQDGSSDTVVIVRGDGEMATKVRAIVDEHEAELLRRAERRHAVATAGWLAMSRHDDDTDH